jgi:hypothetical protein
VRERSRRHLLALGGSAMAVALVAPSIAWSAGNTYEVVQCDPKSRAVSGISLDDAPAYAVTQMCDDARNNHAIKITNTSFARYGRSGRAAWSTGSPALRIVGVSVDARLRRDNGHVPRLFVADAAGNEVARVASGVSQPTDFLNYSWRSSGARPEQFVAHLRCENPDGCHQSDLAKTWLRDVHLTVADYANPVLEEIGGTMFGPGWLRGNQTLYVRGADIGSGIRATYISVNSAMLTARPGTCNTIPGAAFAPTFEPCLPELEMRATVSTTAPPFQDGRNNVAVCAADYSANRTCAVRVIEVDNTPPALAFADAQDPDDPELIRAPVSDATSGVSSGAIYYRAVGSDTWQPLDTQLHSSELQARVDSTLDPPGQYEFMAVAADAAGNTATSTQHADGTTMILTFPLKSGVHLNGHLTGGSSHVTVGYGEPSKVSGILVDAAGEPLEDQQVTVTEHFGEGALIDRRVRTVSTNEKGRWKERLPGGPSRRITATYAGTPRYLPDATGVGRLNVKTKATLRLSRRKVPEGGRVSFKGRVGHLAARIPPGGKLVELEVKDGHSWQTVRHPFYTRADGKYKLHYRFARFYTRNVRYRFRVKVLREHDWPYKAPASSRVRELVVKAR